MNKFISRLVPRRKGHLLIPPILSAVILLLVFSAYNLYPFGDNTLSWCDMSQQSLPLMMQGGRFISENSHSFYSLLTGGGMNILGVFFFFVASPFTLLTPFVDSSAMLLWANLLVLFKIALASFTFALWLEEYFCGECRALNILLSLSYGFCGFNLMYYQNNIWMDIVYLFPLLMLFTFRLLQGRGCVGFVVLLTAILFTNYYIAYNTILFLLFFCGIYCLLMGEELPSFTIIRLGVGVLCSGLLSAPVWLPSFMQYLQSARSDNSNIGVSTFLPNIYTTLGILLPTALAVMGLLLLLFAPRPQVTTVAFGYSFLCMALPLVVDPINRVWHLGSYQAFPARYGYILAFLGLSLTGGLVHQRYRKDHRWLSSHPLTFVVLGGMIFAVGVYCSLLLEEEFSKLISYTSKLWLSADSFFLLAGAFGSVVICGMVLWFCYDHRKIGYRTLCLGWCALVMIESLFSCSVYMGGASSNGTHFYWIASLENQIKEEEFYRVKTAQKLFAVNWLGALGYPNLAHYTSLTTEDTLFSAKSLGYSAYWMEVGGYGGSILSDLILQNNYVIGLTGRSYDFAEQWVYQSDAYTIWEHDLSMPLGSVVSGVAEDYSALSSGARLSASGELFSTLYHLEDGHDTGLVTAYPYDYLANTGRNGDTFTPLDPEFPSFMDYTVKVEGETALYFDCFHQYSNNLREPINDSVSISINGDIITSSYPSQLNNGLLFLGVYEEQVLNIRVELQKEVTAYSFGVFGVDLVQLGAIADRAEGEIFDFTTAGSGFSARAYSEYGESFAFLPLAYDEGFSARVNGKSTSVEKVFGNFIAVALEEGENHIQLTYRPKGLTVGVILFGVGMILLFYLWRKSAILFSYLAPFNGVVTRLFYGLVALFGVLVYVYPVVRFVLF